MARRKLRTSAEIGSKAVVGMQHLPTTFGRIAATIKKSADAHLF
jgi:hypothetical protein